jgi:hypothetical protein
MTMIPAMIRRVGAALAAVLAVTAAFASGFLVAQGRGADGPPAVRLAAAGLGSGLSCDALRQWYVDRALDRVTAWGWGPRVMYPLGRTPAQGDASSPLTTPRTATTPTTTSETGTNVQESGVDEPDVVKTSGTLLVRVVDDTLTTYDVSGPRPGTLGSALLTGLEDPQLLLVGDRVVALGGAAPSPVAGATNGPARESTWVRTFDVSDPSRPTQVDSREYDGRLLTARQTGDVVRLVLTASLPSLPFVTPDPTRTDAAALRANRAVVRATTISDWLPAVTAGSDHARPVVSCSDVAVPDHDGGLGTLSVVGFRASAPDDTDTTAVATSSDLAYLSPDLLVVADSPALAFRCCLERPLPGAEIAPDVAPRAMPEKLDDRTRLYAFDLGDTSATYVGSAAVDGQVAASWAMDEQDGVLRVAVGAAYGRSSNAVVLLRPDAGRLVEVGRLDGLGPDQQIRSMRWLGDTAVMVTYRQVDPFYVLDLADPVRPQVLGALHLPGWSSYLHPVGPHLVLGLGQTSPQIMVDPPVPVPVPKPTSSVTAQPSSLSVSHAKATLVDIRDLAHPRARATVDYPAGSIAQAGMQPHQVTWLPESRTLLTVVSDGYGGRVWLSVLTVGDGSLHDRLVPVATTGDVGAVRTVPVADGRVVLVAGDSVRFLSL